MSTVLSNFAKGSWSVAQKCWTGGKDFLEQHPLAVSAVRGWAWGDSRDFLTCGNHAVDETFSDPMHRALFRRIVKMGYEGKRFFENTLGGRVVRDVAIGIPLCFVCSPLSAAVLVFGSHAALSTISAAKRLLFPLSFEALSREASKLSEEMSEIEPTAIPEATDLINQKLVALNKDADRSIGYYVSEIRLKVKKDEFEKIQKAHRQIQKLSELLSFSNSVEKNQKLLEIKMLFFGALHEVFCGTRVSLATLTQIQEAFFSESFNELIEKTKKPPEVKAAAVEALKEKAAATAAPDGKAAAPKEKVVVAAAAPDGKAAAPKEKVVVAAAAPDGKAAAAPDGKVAIAAAAALKEKATVEEAKKKYAEVLQDSDFIFPASYRTKIDREIALAQEKAGKCTTTFEMLSRKMNQTWGVSLEIEKDIDKLLKFEGTDSDAIARRVKNLESLAAVEPPRAPSPAGAGELLSMIDGAPAVAIDKVSGAAIGAYMKIVEKVYKSPLGGFQAPRTREDFVANLRQAKKRLNDSRCAGGDSFDELSKQLEKATEESQQASLAVTSLTALKDKIQFERASFFGR
jgi:hypothetical protein